VSKTLIEYIDEENDQQIDELQKYVFKTIKSIKHVAGEKFGKLRALCLISTRPTMWLCECECGNYKILPYNNFSRGMTQSCGCMRKTKRHTILNIYSIEEDYIKIKIIKSPLAHAVLPDELAIKTKQQHRITTVTETKIDIEDFEKVVEHKWYYSHQHGYICAKEPTPTPSRKGIYLHRVIMGDTNGMVDHVDQDKTNNRKENLRLCTISQNAMNTKLYKSNTSGYKGVYYDKKSDAWRAKIEYKRKVYNLGLFSSAEKAAAARDKKAIELCSDFCCTGKEK